MMLLTFAYTVYYTPLGMESGAVKDKDILASSEGRGQQARCARLNNSDCWRPDSNTSRTQQFLEVDLGEETVVTGVVTQGNPDDNEWVEKYKVAYRKDKDSHWEYCKNNIGRDMIFDGNEDNKTTVTQLFPTPVTARYIRIEPDAVHGQLALRAEILGYSNEERDRDSYILCTDADVKFSAKDANALLDVITRDPAVGAVCGRTHPTGSGPMVWYQIFDYAIGHWFQKTANDTLGTVLCCPGCFSVYRSKAVREAVKTYASKVDKADEFLTKDMGEDRWFCTLLVERGWLLRYTAVAEDTTYCPEEFDEFFKQRRRWTPSTLANLMLLIRTWGEGRMKNQNISVFFIFYQACLLFSTLIGPATCILIVQGGLEYVFGYKTNTPLFLQLAACLLFAWCCLNTSQSFQLLLAKGLTLIYALVMTVVAIGTAKQIVVAFITNSSASGLPERIIACPTEPTKILQCPGSLVLNITNATYGRTDPNTCGADVSQVWSPVYCPQYFAEAYYQNLTMSVVSNEDAFNCQGKQLCNLIASKEYFPPQVSMQEWWARKLERYKTSATNVSSQGSGAKRWKRNLPQLKADNTTTEIPSSSSAIQSTPITVVSSSSAIQSTPITVISSNTTVQSTTTQLPPSTPPPKPTPSDPPPPDCSAVYLEVLYRCRRPSGFDFSVDIPANITVLYFLCLIGIFIVTALVHPSEFYCVLHGIWYLFCLPGGYLILMIYSICNMTDRSWGTREQKTFKPGGGGGGSWFDNLMDKLRHLCTSCCPWCRPGGGYQRVPTTERLSVVSNQSDGEDDTADYLEESKDGETESKEDEAKPTVDAEEIEVEERSAQPKSVGFATSDGEEEDQPRPKISRKKTPWITKGSRGPSARRLERRQTRKYSQYYSRADTQIPVRGWLERYFPKWKPTFKDTLEEFFTMHGYDDTSFVSGMKNEDLIDIGMTGDEYSFHRKKLMREITRLPEYIADYKVPESTREWLKSIGMSDYLQNFLDRDVVTKWDLAIVKSMKVTELNERYHITKKAHVKRIMHSLKNMRNPNDPGMATANRAPKQWCLTKKETINSFENWRANQIYVLSLDPSFTPFLADGVTWQKRTAGVEHRGYTNDGKAVPEAQRRTAAQKAASLELMLGQVANFCPVISRNRIVKASTSLTDIWQAIRLHFGFQSTGGYFLDIAKICLEPNERPEDLYQRLTAAVEDNLLTTAGGITHHGELVTSDEEVSPSLENMVVLLWLQMLHPGLPAKVKQRYGAELRNKTLSSIKPEISLSVDTLLAELQDDENVRSLRLEQTRKQSPRAPQGRSRRPKPQSHNRACPLCKQAGRSVYDHFLSVCPYLPEQDKKYMVRTRAVEVEDYSDIDPSDDEEPIASVLRTETSTFVDDQPALMSRVTVRASPHLEVFHNGQPVNILLDSGAESSMIRADEAKRLGLRIHPNTSQTPSQADGGRMAGVLGECRTTFYRRKAPLRFDALVVSDLASPIIAGSPFLEANGFTINFKTRQIHLADGSATDYSSSSKPPRPRIHRITNNLLRMQDKTTTLWPNDYLELQLPDGLDTYPDVALEPRQDSLSCEHLKAFRQGTYRNIAGYIRVPNVSCAPVNVTKNMHLFNATPVVPVEDILPDNELPTQDTLPAHIPEPQPFSDSVQLDPDNILNSTQRYRMSSMLQDFDNVFNTDFPGYNGAVGPIHAVVNMGPAQPPQRKGRLPLYGRNRLVELQQKLDELETHGVISTPESADTVVEYLNPSFLVNKPKGGHRLVTAFTDVAKYCKPQPSLLPNVNQVMRQIACWKYLIVSDLTSAYHQIPLHPSSRKYCGIVTPFKGIRVYCRSAMGMPGSETALEELMSRTLGDLLMRGMVAKIADDLYCGGNTYEELLTNWSAVLTALQNCDLRLSPSKTIICPAKTTILGWHWDQGKISASHHTLCTLSTTPPPPSVTALRSFIGSYKALSRVIPGTSVLLGPLDDMVAGRSSSDMIQWTDDQLSVFRKAQQGLKSHQAVVLPRPDDELWLVTDAAVRPTGIGATLFIRRDNNTRVAGFFSCKLKKYQRQWLPCELEALAITSALKHFKPYLIQTTMPAFILTDSKPCVEAVEKLRRGEFSYSPRVSTFLAAVSQFPITVKHISGKYNLSTDFASRHPLDCADSHCQICSFVHALSEEPVVNTATVSPDTDLNNPIYTSRSAWSTIQSSCPSLRRVFAHLKQGTRPSKKETHIRDIKSYLAKATITTDGLLVVPNRDMFGMTRDRIIVPRNVVHGLTTAIHLKLGHPSEHQLKAVMSRYFYALGMDTVIQKVTAACDQCAALKCHIPVPPTFTTQPPPQTILATFAADVMKRARQNILVVRECSTSYTSTQIVPDETSTALRDGLITLCAPLCPLDGPPAVIRCDPAPRFQALTQDTWLAENHLQIEIGEFKNINKNPVAERAIEEMREELCKTFLPLHLQYQNKTITRTSRHQQAFLSLHPQYQSRTCSRTSRHHQSFQPPLLPYQNELCEADIERVRYIVDQLQTSVMLEPSSSRLNEALFWEALRAQCLDPELTTFNEVDELKQALVDLRNGWLMVFAVANAIWLTLILVLTSQSELAILGSNPIGLATALCFGVIQAVQFLAMLFHRGITLMHHTARIPYPTRRPTFRNKTRKSGARLSVQAMPSRGDVVYHNSLTNRQNGVAYHNHAFMMEEDEGETVPKV
ncbi:RS1 [Branchiostoma lanceolatum]|uniref:RS1 protein n=1 Tax=Branchiostoma lanceolatum TaxID=7740 RepID=A0A8J9YX42_BRALA|nr:RS1 [Branchiostoma lanceolatum]